MGFYLGGTAACSLTLKQRFAGFIATCLVLANITTTGALLLLPFVMMLSQPLIIFSSEKNLRMLLILVCASVVSEWLDDCTVSLVTSYNIAIAEGHATHWIAPCQFHP